MSNDKRRYSRVTVDLPNHPKLLNTSNPIECMALYVCGLLYCAEFLTDGAIPKRIVRRLLPDEPVTPLRDLCDELIYAGFWTDEGSEYHIHDYLKHQMSRAAMEAQIEGGRKGGLARTYKGSSKGSLEGNSKLSSSQTDRELNKELDLELLKDKPLSIEPVQGIPDQVLGYWMDKVGREPRPADFRSLRTICKAFPAHIVNLAIGQCCTQGASADNFALITTIARAETA